MISRIVLGTSVFATITYVILVFAFGPRSWKELRQRSSLHDLETLTHCTSGVASVLDIATAITAGSVAVCAVRRAPESCLQIWWMLQLATYCTTAVAVHLGIATGYFNVAGIDTVASAAGLATALWQWKRSCNRSIVSLFVAYIVMGLGVLVRPLPEFGPHVGWLLAVLWSSVDVVHHTTSPSLYFAASAPILVASVATYSLGNWVPELCSVTGGTHWMWHLFEFIGYALLYLGYLTHGSPSMDADDARVNLFWVGCISIRVLIGAVAFALTLTQLDVAFYTVGVCAAIVAAGFAKNAVRRAWTGKNGVGFTGGRVWWARIRVVHCALWALCSTLCFARVQGSGVLLLVDAGVGVVSGTLHTFRGAQWG